MFRNLPGCREVPVILLSIDDDPHTRALAAQLGVDIFLPHPIELVRLHHAINTAVHRAMTRRPKVAVLRDPDAARQIMQEHMETARRYMEESEAIFTRGFLRLDGKR